MSKLRVLVVHNFYQQRGGEDAVFESEVELLERHGHVVETFTRHNDSLKIISKTSALKQAFWSDEASVDAREKIERFQPDVIHVHNTFPLISPAIYWVAASRGIPIVQTLHNFRLLCPQAMFLREGKVCEDCLGALPWRSVVFGCYRDSKLQSAVVAGSISVHRALGTWANKVTRYIALNEFCRKKFIQGGIPAEKISVKPNFVDIEKPALMPRKSFLFVGRLSVEKGVSVLRDAMQGCEELVVRIAGSGPELMLFDDVQGVKLLGQLGLNEVRTEMSSATALVLPSIWYENFPRTLVEAYACGLPVIASRIGALQDLVSDGVTGLLFEAGNSADLRSKMKWAMQNPGKMLEMGQNARKLFDESFNSKKNYEQLLMIYSDAVREKKKNLREHG